MTDRTAPREAFLCPRTRAINSPADVRAETIRRVELHILHLLHGWAVRAALPSLTDSRSDSQDDTSTGVSKPTRPASATTVGSTRPLAPLRDELLVLRVLYGNVQQAIISTQRDVYYHLIRQVPAQQTVNAAVQRLVAQLGVPRQALGVVAGTRGTVGGCLRYRGVPLWGRARACGADAGMAIPLLEEDLRVCPMTVGRVGHAVDAPFELESHVRVLVVVEKHAVLHRLLQERLPARLPCVLLSAHGFPTHAARQLLRNLHEAAPTLPVVALVDYNPSGLVILHQYRWGGRPPAGASSPPPSPHPRSRGGMFESRFTDVPALRWLGPRSSHLGFGVAGAATSAGAEATVGQPWTTTPPAGLPYQRFSARDTAVMRTLLGELTSHPPARAGVGAENDSAGAEMGLRAVGDPTAAGESLRAPVPGLVRSEADGGPAPVPLLNSCATDTHAWAAEAAVMAAAGVKVEMEAMYTRGTTWSAPAAPPSQGWGTTLSFADWVCQCILRRDYI